VGNTTSGAGGSGGGAVLLASNQNIVVFPSGVVDAKGGMGGAGTIFQTGQGNGGSGSGGAIRMIASQISVQGLGQLLAGGGNGVAAGGQGRIRLEAPSISISGTAVVDVPPSLSVPSFLFPPASTPKLRGSLVGTHPVPTDPTSDGNPDVTLTGCASVAITVEAENIALGTGVKVRIVPEAGPAITALTSGLTGTFQTSTAITAPVTFPTGVSHVQLTASVSLAGMARGATAVLPPSLKNPKTLSGERVTDIEVSTDASGRSSVIYITESGNRIPVGTR